MDRLPEFRQWQTVGSNPTIGSRQHRVSDTLAPDAFSDNAKTNAIYP
jgi:hypothetical protein